MSSRYSDHHHQQRQETVALSQKWYKVALQELSSLGLGQPSLSIIQTVLILTLCNSNFGHSEREMFLVGVAISAARALKMHRLGTESTYPQSLKRYTEWQTREGRELGRRMWWTLTIADW